MDLHCLFFPCIILLSGMTFSTEGSIFPTNSKLHEGKDFCQVYCCAPHSKKALKYFWISKLYLKRWWRLPGYEVQVKYGISPAVSWWGWFHSKDNCPTASKYVDFSQTYLGMGTRISVPSTSGFRFIPLSLIALIAAAVHWKPDQKVNRISK